MMPLISRRPSRHRLPSAVRQRTVGARARTGISSALLVASAIGCGSDEDATNFTSMLDSGADAPAPESSYTPEPSDMPANPLYAIMYEVYDDTGSTSYLSLLDTLDIEAVDTSTSREYGRGRAFVQAYNGWLYVGDAESPTVTRFSVDDSGELVEDGTISFLPYGLQQGQFDSWNATFISPDKAYLMDFGQGRTIIWNPTTLEILGAIEPPDELFRPGVTLEGSPAAVRDGLLFRTFNWVNYDDATYSTDFLLAIYDVQTDQLLELVPETRCPVPGNLVQTDEAGNIYFSNWIWPVAGTIMRGAPSSCVLRINAGATRFDPEWTLNYGDLTEGRRGAMFTYLPGNRALISAFYEERTSFDATTDPWSYVGSSNWRIWNADLTTMTATPIQGIDFNGGAYTPVQFDNRVFLMVPGGEEESYATQLYEVTDGTATPYVKLPGWSYQFVKLR
jgi:hypothetical protein